MQIQGFIYILLWALALLGLVLYFAWTDMVSSDWKEIFKFLFKCITVGFLIALLSYWIVLTIKNACV